MNDTERITATLLIPPTTKQQPIRMHVLTPDGINTGGSCGNCGGRLAFWYDAKICDKCIGGRTVTQQRRRVSES